MAEKRELDTVRGLKQERELERRLAARKSGWQPHPDHQQQMSPEELEEERIGWERHRHAQRTQLERMRHSLGSPKSPLK